MLNLFPIQFLAPLAYLLLRLVLGILFLRLARTQLQQGSEGNRSWIKGVYFILVGTLCILGLYTQLAALGALIAACASRLPSVRSRRPYFTTTTAVLVGAISLSLLITGGGPFGFDLPI